MKNLRKLLFNCVYRIGDGVYDGFHIYLLGNPGDEVLRYRVDVGMFGSFEVARFDGDEEYNVSKDEWEYVNKRWYQFFSMHELNEDFTPVTIESALAFISEKSKGLITLINTTKVLSKESRTHISESGNSLKSLCGKDLGFDWCISTVSGAEDETTRYYSQDEVLASPVICSTCLKVFKSIANTTL